MSNDIGRLAATVAAWGSPTVLRPPTEPLDGRDWASLMQRVRSQRLSGLLAWAVATEEWPASSDQRSQIDELHRTAMASALRLEAALLEVADLLDDAGARFRVLKGSAGAHLDYPDPSLRCFGDVDLLIPGDDIERARDVLLARGGRRSYAEPRPGFDRRFSKGLAVTTPSGVEIDLHRTLAAGPFGLSLDLDGLRSGGDSFSVGGRRLGALGRPQRFVHSCFHAVLGSAVPRLVPLRDLIQTAPGSSAELEVVRQLAERSQATAVVARAVRAAGATLGWQAPGPLEHWAHSYRETNRDRRWLAGYLGQRRAYATQAITAVEAVPGGPTAKAAYVWAVLFPADASKGSALWSRWRRGFRAIRRRVVSPR